MSRYKILKTRKVLGFPAPACRECRWCRRYAPKSPGLDRCAHRDTPYEWCTINRMSNKDCAHFEPWRWMPHYRGFSLVVWPMMFILVGLNAAVAVLHVMEGFWWGALNMLPAAFIVLVWPGADFIPKIVRWWRQWRAR